jgi:hypothetical protein
MKNGIGREQSGNAWFAELRPPQQATKERQDLSPTRTTRPNVTAAQPALKKRRTYASEHGVKQSVRRGFRIFAASSARRLRQISFADAAGNAALPAHSHASENPSPKRANFAAASGRLPKRSSY